MEKEQVLQRMRDAHAELEALLTRMDEQRMLERGVQDDWSVKDLLAHMAEWQALAARWLGDLQRGETPADAKVWSNDELNRVNAQFYAQNRGRALADVLRDYRQSQHALYAAAASLDDEEINRARDYAWRAGKPLVFLDLIAANSYDHFADHAEALRQWAQGS